MLFIYIIEVNFYTTIKLLLVLANSRNAADNLRCVPLGWIIMVHQRDRWIHEHSWFIGSFQWRTIIWVILDYWCWSRSFQRNEPLESNISVHVFGSRLLINTVFKLGPGMHQSCGDCAVCVLSSNITRWKDALPQIEFCDLTGSKRILLRECPPTLSWSCPMTAVTPDRIT